jgi:hypothetical protein
MIDRVTWPAVLYAVLSLTVVRMLPVFLCLIGRRTTTVDKLFIGWFGPRGLATIVFAVLVLDLDEKLPGNDTIMLAAGSTVLLSVIAHGVTAKEDGGAFAGQSRGRCSGYQVRMKPMSPGIPPGYSRTSALSPNPSGRR